MHRLNLRWRGSLELSDAISQDEENIELNRRCCLSWIFNLENHETGSHKLICLNAWSPLVKLFGKDSKDWPYWWRCTTEGRFGNPDHSQLAFVLPCGFCPKKCKLPVTAPVPICLPIAMLLTQGGTQLGLRL